MSVSKLDAEQARVMKAVGDAVADYRKRNSYTGKKGEALSHEPPYEYVEKLVRQNVSSDGLILALARDAYEKVTEKK